MLLHQCRVLTVPEVIQAALARCCLRELAQYQGSLANILD